MTETSQDQKSTTMKFALPIIVAVLLVAAIGYFATQKSGGIDHYVVQTEVDKWIAQHAEKHPETQITYEAIAMAGDVSTRHAIVTNLRVTYPIKNEEGEASSAEILAPSLKVEPENITFDAFNLTLLAPVRITEDDEVTTIATEPLLQANVSLKESGFVDYSVPLKGVWRVTKDDEPNALLLTMADGAHILGKHAVDDSRNGEFKLTIGEMSGHVEGDETSGYTMQSLGFDAKFAPQEQAGYGAANVRFQLAQLFTDEESMPYGPLNITLNGEYSGPMPQDDRAVDWTSEKALIDVSAFSVEAKDAALNAKLNFQTGRGELLPIGEGQLDIRNFAYVVKELRDRDVLGEAEDKLLGVLAKQITGAELDAITDLTIPLKRVDGGSLQVGKSSFEELFAIVLTGGQIMPQAAPAAPETPVAPAETAEELIDESEVEALFDE